MTSLSDGVNRRKVIRKVVGGSAVIVADATQENLIGGCHSVGHFPSMEREGSVAGSRGRNKGIAISLTAAPLYNLHAIAASPTISIVHFPEGSLVRAVESFEHFRTIHG